MDRRAWPCLSVLDSGSDTSHDAANGHGGGVKPKGLGGADMVGGDPGSGPRGVQGAGGAAAEQPLSDDAYLRRFGVEPALKRALGTVTGALFGMAFQGPTAGSLLVATAC